MENKIILYANQSVDFILLSSQDFTEDEKEILITPTDEDDIINLSWEDFSNADILCNYTSTLSSSFLEGLSGTLTGYDIRKRKRNETSYEEVGVFSLEELNEATSEESLYYSIIDFKVCNNTEYIYTIFPIANESTGISLEGSVYTEWDNYTLQPLVKISENKYTAHEDEIWSFSLNCEEGAITQNIDRTIFTSFSPKPKISIGEINYNTGSLKALIGNMDANCKYIDTNVLIRRWKEFVAKGELCLFKNPKGDMMIVIITDTPSIEYMNTTSYHHFDENYNEVVNRPATISFNYTEVMDVDKLIISKVGEL